MIIPASAIEPFGVIGIPKFSLTEDMDSLLREAMDTVCEYGRINDRLKIASILLFIKRQFDDREEEYVKVDIDGPRREKNKMNMMVVSIYYGLPNGSVRVYRRTIYANKFTWDALTYANSKISR